MRARLTLMDTYRAVGVIDQLRPFGIIEVGFPAIR